MANYQSNYTGTEIDDGVENSINNPILIVDCSDPNNWDSVYRKLTDSVLETICNGYYPIIRLINVPVVDAVETGTTVSTVLFNNEMVDIGQHHSRTYFSFDDGNQDLGDVPAIVCCVITNEEEDPTDYQITNTHYNLVNNEEPAQE